jgi:hypothetical protein
MGIKDRTTNNGRIQLVMPEEQVNGIQVLNA